MSDNLPTYMNDHLAGARFAIELLERLRDSTTDKRFADHLSQLLEQIEEDRDVLQGLVDRLGQRRSALKEAGAWLAEKASRIKLPAADDDILGTFETLEALSLGVLGKLKLWQALSLIAANEPLLRGLDYDELADRAQRQHDELEAFRLEAAHAALAGSTAGARSS
jgi:hypothetical protein